MVSILRSDKEPSPTATRVHFTVVLPRQKDRASKQYNTLSKVRQQLIEHDFFLKKSIYELGNWQMIK